MARPDEVPETLEVVGGAAAAHWVSESATREAIADNRVRTDAPDTQAFLAVLGDDNIIRGQLFESLGRRCKITILSILCVFCNTLTCVFAYITDLAEPVLG